MNPLSFYGMKFNPFNKDALTEKDFFESEDFREMTTRLKYLAKVRGMGVFTASSGMGKTYALRCFAKSLSAGVNKMEYIALSTISIGEFYFTLCDRFGLSRKGGKPGRYKAIQEYLYYMYKEKRQPVIIAIDEAQYLNTAILNDLKIIMNHGYDSLNCFTLILCGEPYLNNTLNKSIHMALKQRIMVHYDFKGLSDEEVKKYIYHKIEIAGASRNIIDEAAVSAIHGYASMNPRVIDAVMTNALMIGAQEQKQSIDADTILAAVNAGIL